MEMNQHRSFDIISIFDSEKSEVIEMLNKIEAEPIVKDKIMDILEYDKGTYIHSEEVAIISIILGKKMKLNKSSLFELGISAILHDYGKIKIPIEIINKPGKLDIVEREIIEVHTALGAYYLRQEPFSKNIIEGVYEHHESFIGSERGYPRQLVNDEIHIYGRIISVADKIDAYTAKRIYHDERSVDELREFIYHNEDLDEQIVHIAMRLLKGNGEE